MNSPTLEHHQRHPAAFSVALGYSPYIQPHLETHLTEKVHSPMEMYTGMKIIYIFCIKVGNLDSSHSSKTSQIVLCVSTH